MALSNNNPLLFVLVWVGFFAWTTISEACYFPDGIQATDNTPCYQNGSISVCCGPGFTCLTNGLCQQGQNLFRGTCTDSTWKSESCPKFCTSGRQLDNWMSSCPGVGSGYFCCGVDDSCCKNSTLILDLGFGTAITTASSTSTSSTSTASNQPTSTIASSQTTSASSNLPSTHNNNVQVNGNDTPGTNVALAAGVGAGVGLPVCAAIVAFIFFCRRRHRQVALDKDFSESQPRKLPLRELESNAPRSEVGSTALCELSTASLCELSTARG